MGKHGRYVLAALVVLGLVLVLPGLAGAAKGGINKPWLGAQIYFDKNLSIGGNQSCASCHWPTAGFSEPDTQYPVSEGSIDGLFGGRSSPSAAYAAFSPLPFFDAKAGTWVGGQFWDGRAPDLVAQAKGPFLNPVEMAMPDEESVVNAVADSYYANDFRAVFGPSALSTVTVVDTTASYHNIAVAIAAFESTGYFNRFSSDFDVLGPNKLTAQQQEGYKLFTGKAMCDLCHPAKKGPYAAEPLFTDFSYDNLGIPVNEEVHTLTGDHSVDRGLGAALVPPDPMHDGKFQVPTLRNVALSPPYGHNGYFATLYDIVHFYNTRDVPGSAPGGGDWDPPEVTANVNTAELGDLGLTSAEELAIVAFLESLTDTPPPVPPMKRPVGVPAPTP